MPGRHELPFDAEYAKSGRAGCKKCKTNIADKSLRLAVMVQSPHFDGKVPTWFHPACFFQRARVKTEADIHGFDSLRWDDQELIRQNISGAASGVSGVKKNSPLMDYSVEYASSGRAKCRICEEKIEKDAVRISRLDYEGKGAAMAGKPVPGWHHAECFVNNREELEFYEAADKLPGFKKLKADDQEELKSKMKAMKGHKRKASQESVNGSSDEKAIKLDSDEQEQLKKQNAEFWKIRDALEQNLKKNDMSELLECNKQQVPSGESKILDRLADCMLFGALEPCKECKGGQLVYSTTTNAYLCTGHISGFTACQFTTQKPKRHKFVIPEDFEEVPFVSTFKCKVGERMFPAHKPVPTAVAEQQASSSANGVTPKDQPLDGLKLLISGTKFSRPKKDLTRMVKELGGDVVTKPDSDVAIAVGLQSDVDKLTKPMTELQKQGIHVVSEEFVSEIAQAVEDGRKLVEFAKEKLISTWGDDFAAKVDRVKVRKKSFKSGAQRREEREEKLYKSQVKSLKMKVKGGGAVDPESGLEDCCHVFEDGKNKYNAILGVADAQAGTNSFYRLQVYKHDDRDKFYVWRVWGRLGTTIGGNKLESFKDEKRDAIDHFKALYLDKTGNEWDRRHDFVKRPHKYYPMELDYGSDEESHVKPSVTPGSQSKLDPAVQDIVKMIFDIETMKQTMKEFEIDLTKMPLGKLKKSQIEQGYRVLTELQELFANAGDQPPNASRVLDATNRFFTFIPHDFGMQRMPLLDNKEIIQEKSAMLDNLLEIEIAFSILHSGKKAAGDRDPIDVEYEKLNTKLEVLDKDTEEYKNIQLYVTNTHGKTHSGYSLKLEKVFKVERTGELKRYKPFKGLHNRMLLWHGSRVSNYAGILSQGLRIAPPEAPVTGYMFGKGIYFADMVSKSANYCGSGPSNPTGLMLLSEVALGNMLERKHADPIKKLPANMHSCKGVGRSMPDPGKVVTTPEGVGIPLGKGVDSQVQGTSLLYNEFIVYDVAQVNIKYLLKMKFSYNY